MSLPIHGDTVHFITTQPESGHVKTKKRRHDTYSSKPAADKIRIVAVSDTHSHPDWAKDIPSGDVFIHCGDLTRAGTYAQIMQVYSDIKALPHKHKIVIAGNHDLGLDQHFVRDHQGELKRFSTGIDEVSCRRLRALWHSREASAAGIHFLEHEYVTLLVRGKTIHFFGSPCTPEFYNWAFMYPLTQDVWSPGKLKSTSPGTMSEPPERKDRDALIWITHGPAKGVLDAVVGVGSVGCPFLSEQIGRVKPDVHFFGHIHEGAQQGLYERKHEDGSITTCINAALLDERYRLAYKPTVIDL